jgi:mitotic spindle assembly checkpoint protein MAD1
MESYTQVFTAKSAEFREAIASILGLKLAFYPNGQVRVTSVYDLSASFVFQPAPKSSDPVNNEGARMQLVAQGEGGPQDLPQLMRYWVEDEQCIPGFLASVTLECWEKVKREPGEAVLTG